MLENKPFDSLLTETKDQMNARWESRREADLVAISLGLAYQDSQQGVVYWTGNGEQFRAGYWAGREEPAAVAVPVNEQLKALKAKTACCMGVGNGDGNLFVYGDYDSIKAAQALVLRAEAKAAVQAVPEQWTDLARRCLIAMEMAVEWGKTREGRPPAQTCLFEIDDLRAMLAAPQAQPADALPLTDDQIEAEFTGSGGMWTGEYWKIEDADLHPYVRKIKEGGAA
ncbi:hypothetical protein [Comamonas sp. JNW]|uniref:hypothetical protein n=1 Tax=Comamonas sp. JNW TaxID=2170731 RepID=UPI0010580AFA|nr:hypothetical protein [Comamonas sp. JNW]